tara:strand:+ start:433 stop:1197 length:765 start_codon:yes stop_codon:yes gene_type:complete
MNKIGAMVVNRNRGWYTNDLVADLKEQTIGFDLTIVDQASEQPCTSFLLEEWRQLKNTTIIQNKKNLYLNHVWNSFYENSSNEYLSFLNNDMRITSNFMSDSQAILDKEPLVGCVIHATNHPKFTYKKDDLDYFIFPPYIARQGYDWTIRREAYNLIPEELLNYCGDDYVFHKLYGMGYNVAIALSSPVLHYANVSVPEFIESFGDGGGMETLGPRDLKTLSKLGIESEANIPWGYSHAGPSKEFIENFLEGLC